MASKFDNLGNSSYFCAMNETFFGFLDRQMMDSDIHAINYGAILYNKKGGATVRINFDVWQLRADSVIIFFPGDVVKWEQMDDDFQPQVIRYSSEILRSASLNIEHAVYEQLRADRLCGYKELVQTVVESMFRIIEFYFTTEHYSLTDRIVQLHLQAFFLGYYDYLQAHPRADNRDKSTQRVEELFNRFMELLENEYQKGHEVNYYAGRMNITRKYLGIIVHSKTGISPKRIIDEYLILQLKLALRTTKRSLKQISNDFNFSDQSALTRYFRTHAGISPQQYRLK